MNNCLTSTLLSPNGGSTDEYETDDYSASDVSSSGETSEKPSNGGRRQRRTARKTKDDDAVVASSLNDNARSRGGEPPRHTSNSDSDGDIPIVGKDLNNNETMKHTVASLPPKTAGMANKREASTTNVGTRKSGRKTTATIKAAAASTIATKKISTAVAESLSNVKTTSTNDDDDDDDESDSDDDPFADLSRFNESTKRRKLALSSDDDDDDDDDDSDGSDVSSDEYTSKKVKTKVPNNKSKEPIIKSSAKGKSAYSSSDDNSSIEFPEQTPHPARAAAAAAARSPSKKITATEAIQLLSDDDDDDDVICRTFRSPPKRPASNVSATRNGKQETDPSVRAESNAALEIGRLAREKLKAAQNYKAKELDPIPPPSSTPIQRESVVQRPVVVVRPSYAVIPPVQTTVSYTGPTIQLKLQYTHPVTNKNSKMSVKIKMDQPLQHLVDEFQSKQPTLKITSMKFDGDKLNMTKTPSFFDMDDDDMVDAIVVTA